MRYTFQADLALNSQGNPAALAPFTWWNAPSGGSAYTDVVAADGISAPGTATDANGVRPVVKGPDGVRIMWMDAASGYRQMVTGAEAINELYTLVASGGGGGGGGGDVPSTRQIVAGAGLSGGGTLAGDITIALASPIALSFAPTRMVAFALSTESSRPAVPSTSCVLVTGPTPPAWLGTNDVYIKTAS